MSSTFSEVMSSVRSTDQRHTISEMFHSGDAVTHEVFVERSERSSSVITSEDRVRRFTDAILDAPVSARISDTKPTIFSEIRPEIAERGVGESPTLSATNVSAKGFINGHSIPPFLEQSTQKSEVHRTDIELKGSVFGQSEKKNEFQLKGLLEEQAKWDKEANVTDEKQAQLFHTQWALLRDQFSFFSSELVQIRADLQSVKDWQLQEPRLRQESDEKLAAEIKANYTYLIAAINDEVKDRISFCSDATSLANHAKQLIEQENRDRMAAENELTRRMQSAIDAVEHERLDREQSHMALHSHVNSLQQELTLEKTERSHEDATLKRFFQTLEVEMKDLRISIDSRIEKGLENVQRLIDTECGKRVRLLEDVEKNLSILKTDLDQESKSRSGQTLQLTNGQQKLKDMMEAECGNRAKAMSEFGDRVRNLSDSLLSEAKDRSSSDQELKKEITSLREALDNETRQRAAGNRELKDALLDETGQRVEGDENSKAGLNGLSSRLEDELVIVREMLTKEVRDRSSAENDLSCMESRLKTIVEGEVHALRDADARLGNEVRDGLRELAEALAQETSERTRERASSDDVLAKELEKNKSELAIEKAARTDALAVLGLAVQTLDANTSQHFDEVWTKQEEETKSRSALASSLEKQFIDLISADNEHDKVLRALQRDLDAEAKQRGMSDDVIGRALEAEAAERKAGDEAALKNFNELSIKLGQDQVRVADQLMQRTTDIIASLEQEIQVRVASNEDFSKYLQELRAELEREREQRDHGDAALWKDIAENQQELAGEKGERLKSDDAVRRDVQGMLEKMNSQHLDELLKLDRDMSARDLAINQQEQNFRILRDDLEQEGKLRIASNDTLQDMISIEKSERIAGDEENMHRLTGALVKLDSGVEAFRDLMQGRLAALSGKLDKPKVEPARVTTFYIGED